MPRCHPPCRARGPLPPWLIALGALAGSAAVASAALEWETKELAAESAPGQREVVARFPFVNRGDYPVRVTALRSGCDCTVATAPATAVAPGATAQVTVTFRVGNRTGHQEKLIVVGTDDPRRSDAILKLEVQIREALRLMPKLVRWVPGGDMGTRRIAFAVAPEIAAMQVAADCSHPGFTVRVEGPDAAGNGVLLVMPPGPASLRESAGRPARVDGGVKAAGVTGAGERITAGERAEAGATGSTGAGATAGGGTRGGPPRDGAVGTVRVTATGADGTGHAACVHLLVK